MRIKQLDVFSASVTEYNKALKYLLDFNPDEAERHLSIWERRHSNNTRDLGHERGLIDFLRESEVNKALENDPERAFYIWERRWEPLLSARQDDSREDILSRFKNAYFLRLCRRLEPFKPGSSFHTGGNAVICLMRAGLWERAASAARTAARMSAVPGRLYGYLGDSLFMMKKARWAREAYLEALVAGPYDMDLDRLRDPEISRLMAAPESFLEDGPSINGPPRLELDWCLAIGLLANLLPVPVPRGRKEITRWKKRLTDNTLEPSRPGLAFASGIVLCSLGMEGLRKNGLEIAHIRAHMKRLSPALFTYYMEQKQNLDTERSPKE